MCIVQEWRCNCWLPHYMVYFSIGGLVRAWQQIPCFPEYLQETTRNWNLNIGIPESTLFTRYSQWEQVSYIQYSHSRYSWILVFMNRNTYSPPSMEYISSFSSLSFWSFRITDKPYEKILRIWQAPFHEMKNGVVFKGSIGVGKAMSGSGLVVLLNNFQFFFPYKDCVILIIITQISSSLILTISQTIIIVVK